MKRNIKSALLLKTRQGNHRNSAAPIKRYTDRCERHDAHQSLRTGAWQEEDQFVGETPEVAFSPDIIGERMEKNPAFSFQIGGLL